MPAGGRRRGASGLHPDEQLLLSVRPHWTLVVRPVVATAVVVAGVIALAVGAPHLPAGAHWAEVAAVVVSCLWVIGRLLRWRRTSLIVTSLRLVERHGVLVRREVEVWLARVERVDVVQTLVQRMAGTGKLEVAVWGEVDVWAFSYVRKPVAVQRVLVEWAGSRASGVGWSGDGGWAGDGPVAYDPLRGHNPDAYDPGAYDRPGYGAPPGHGVPGYGPPPDAFPYPPGYRPSLGAEGPEEEWPWR